MRAKSWSSYYESIRNECPWSMYAWSMGKSLHVPFKSYSHIVKNEQIMTPMKMWSIVYEYNGFKVVNDYIAGEVSAWCNERNEEQDIIHYFFAFDKVPVPIIIQQRNDILRLAREGKLNSIIHNTNNPDRFLEKIVEENNNERL